MARQNTQGEQRRTRPKRLYQRRAELDAKATSFTLTRGRRNEPKFLYIHCGVLHIIRAIKHPPFDEM